jgi:MarR family transcriptional regulator, organic hydroperoxide resistance regulator
VSRLLDELKQRKPFRTTAEEAAVSLMRTADLVRRIGATVIEPHGITMQQYNVLRILRGAGEEGLPTLEVGERMVEQTPGVTRLLDRLEAKGLVRRQRCPKDRRQHLCWITPAGLTLLESLDEPVRAATDAALKGLNHEQRIAFIGLLDAIRAAHEHTNEQSSTSR